MNKPAITQVAINDTIAKRWSGRAYDAQQDLSSEQIKALLEASVLVCVTLYVFLGGLRAALVVAVSLPLALLCTFMLMHAFGLTANLMSLGALATIGVQQPRNLAVIVMDNEHYGETGMQRAHTARGVDLAGIAKAAGFKSSTTISSMAGLQQWLSTFHRKPGPVFGDIKVSAAPAPMALPVRDGTAIKYRFRTALLGAKALE